VQQLKRILADFLESGSTAHRQASRDGHIVCGVPEQEELVARTLGYAWEQPGGWR